MTLPTPNSTLSSTSAGLEALGRSYSHSYSHSPSAPPLPPWQRKGMSTPMHSKSRRRLVDWIAVCPTTDSGDLDTPKATLVSLRRGFSFPCLEKAMQQQQQQQPSCKVRKHPVSRCLEFSGAVAPEGTNPCDEVVEGNLIPPVSSTPSAFSASASKVFSGSVAANVFIRTFDSETAGFGLAPKTTLPVELLNWVLPLLDSTSIRNCLLVCHSWFNENQLILLAHGVPEFRTGKPCSKTSAQPAKRQVVQAAGAVTRGGKQRQNYFECDSYDFDRELFLTHSAQTLHPSLRPA